MAVRMTRSLTHDDSIADAATMLNIRTIVLFLLVAPVYGLVSTTSLAEDWPQWRGPRGDGTSLERGIPTRWNGPQKQNIAWKVEIPGRGHASPIVCGDRLFVVSCREERRERMLLCLDRPSGRILWEKVVVVSPLERRHQLNSCASSTPATDGRLVYVAFAAIDPTVARAISRTRTRRRPRRATLARWSWRRTISKGGGGGSCGPASSPAGTASAVRRCCSRTC